MTNMAILCINISGKKGDLVKVNQEDCGVALSILEVNIQKFVIIKMKYNININQRALYDCGANLDMIEAGILDFLIWVCTSPNREIENMRDDEGFTWINYNHLMSEMPLLGIKSKSSLSKRISNIESDGWITIKRKKGGKLYVLLSEKVDLLFSENQPFAKTNSQDDEKANRSRKRTEPFAKTNGTVRENEHDKDYKDNYNNIIKKDLIYSKYNIKTKNDFLDVSEEEEEEYFSKLENFVKCENISDPDKLDNVLNESKKLKDDEKAEFWRKVWLAGVWSATKSQKKKAVKIWNEICQFVSDKSLTAA